jgi:hypothetical protein
MQVKPGVRARLVDVVALCAHVSNLLLAPRNRLQLRPLLWAGEANALALGKSDLYSPRPGLTNWGSCPMLVRVNPPSLHV